jgi:hypothetical protein
MQGTYYQASRRALHSPRRTQFSHGDEYLLANHPPDSKIKNSCHSKSESPVRTAVCPKSISSGSALALTAGLGSCTRCFRADTNLELSRPSIRRIAGLWDLTSMMTFDESQNVFFLD